MVNIFLATAFFLLCNPIFCSATNWYVDSNATGAGDGSTWENAWTSLDAITGVQGDDIVYISGGTHGDTKTYSLNTNRWYPISGTEGHPVTYKIGQDIPHNGTAIFVKNYSGGYDWFATLDSNVIISGDAGDGSQHFKVQGFSTTFYGHATLPDKIKNSRISYVKVEDNAAITLQNVDDIEIDNNYLKNVNVNCDGVIGIIAAGTTWDSVLIHDNELYVISNTETRAFGGDAMQVVGTGASIYNNTISGIAGAYSGSQHQDGYQGTGLTYYLKIYNNTIVDMANYGVYLEAVFGTYQHAYIFNNEIHLTTADITNGNPAGIVVSAKTTGTMLDIVIANNTIVDQVNGRGIAAQNDGNATIEDVYIQNNAIINSDYPTDIDISYNDGVANNAAITKGNASNTFASYVEYNGTSNDMTLKSNDTVCKDKGSSLSSYFTTDLLGISRPQGGAWDIGAYEYDSSQDLKKTISGGSLGGGAMR